MSRRLAASVLALLGLAAWCDAARAEDGRLTLTTERVVVFKDGHCLVVKKAVGVSDASGEVFTEEVPDAAVLGTFWATPDEGRLIGMTSGRHESSSEEPETVRCREVLEILHVNTGAAASVDLDDGTTLRGTIREVLATEEPAPAPPLPAARAAPAPDPAAATRRETTVLTGTLFVLTTDAGDVVLPVARVKRVAMKDAKLERTRTVTEKRSAKRLTFRFEGGAAQRSLHVVYFRPGVRWIPTYRVDLPADADSERRARIRLQAELVNEAEDLVDVPFDVVVGVPNFRFKEVVSPLVLESALRNALREAAPQLMAQQWIASNGFTARAGEWRGPSDATPEATAALSLPEEITASRNQDLFTYSLSKLTLRKGERAAVAVFDAKVPLRDVYTWDLTVARQDNEAAPGGKDVSPLAISDARVWHQIELVNGTQVPWTTGAALVLQGGRPLAQELMTYASAGATVRIPVTVAIDVRGRFAEEETKRDLNALKWAGHPYARIEKAGRAEVTNFKAAAIDVEVRCSFGGRADTATHDGTIALDAFRREDWREYAGHPAVNNHSEILFRIRVEPGATVTPGFTYHFFTRSS